MIAFDYKRLKAERIANGLTVQDMADFLGVSKGTIQQEGKRKDCLNC